MTAEIRRSCLGTESFSLPWSLLVVHIRVFYGFYSYASYHCILLALHVFFELLILALVGVLDDKAETDHQPFGNSLKVRQLPFDQPKIQN
jgi:hypothetical protein